MWSRAELAKMIDHTALRPDATLDDVLRACDAAMEHHFASVVVFPCWVPHAARRLGRGEVRLGTVVGFPFGANATRVKAFEAQSAIAAGADEIEAVINISALKSGDGPRVRRDLEEVLNAAHIAGLTEETQETLTRFVLETCYLREHEITGVAELIREIGGDFLVTSTGYGPRGGTPDEIRLLRRTVGANMGIKAVGGIRSLDAAADLLNAGATRIGTASGIRILEECEAALEKVVAGSAGE